MELARNLTADQYAERSRLPIKLRLTATGELSPLLQLSGNSLENNKIWNDFPGVRWTARVARARPTAQVYLEGTTAAATADASGGGGIPPPSARLPVLAQQDYGRGTVMYFGFDETYRWRSKVGEKYYTRIWNQIVQSFSLERQLGASARTQLKVSRPEYAVGEKVVISGKLFTESFAPLTEATVPGTLVATMPDDPKAKPQSADLPLLEVPGSPGEYQAEFTPAHPGRIPFFHDPGPQGRAEIRGDRAEARTERYRHERVAPAKHGADFRRAVSTGGRPRRAAAVARGAKVHGAHLCEARPVLFALVDGGAHVAGVGRMVVAAVVAVALNFEPLVPMKTVPTKSRPRPAPPSPARRQRELRRTLRHMPAALPPPVQRRLRALSARVVHVSWVEGFLRLLAAACVLLTLQAAADLLFDLPRKTRAGLLALDAVVGVYLFVRYVALPWRRKLVPEEAASLAERRWPDFRTSLISAVQLSRQPDGSPKLVRALLQQVAERAGKMDLRAASTWGRLRNLFAATVLLMLGAAGLAWWAQPKSQILGRRILLANVPLPTRTVVVAISQDLAVVPGQAVEISARAQGEIPRSARVELAYQGKAAEAVPLTAKPASLDVFSLALPNVQQPFTYRFYMNDGRGLEWKVSLLHAPVMQAVKFRQEYPAYTGLAPLELSAGSLRLLAGSRLQIDGRASQPLKGARIVPQGAGGPVEVKLAADRTGFHGELPIPAKGLTAFSVVLQNDQGIESRDNTLYRRRNRARPAAGDHRGPWPA